MGEDEMGWAVAFAVVGIAMAVALGSIYSPSAKDPQVTCIEQHGKWVWTDAWRRQGTCEFHQTGETK